jgi:hypothetical protein
MLALAVTVAHNLRHKPYATVVWDFFGHTNQAAMHYMADRPTEGLFGVPLVLQTYRYAHVWHCDDVSVLHQVDWCILNVEPAIRLIVAVVCEVGRVPETAAAAAAAAAARHVAIHHNDTKRLDVHPLQCKLHMFNTVRE